MHRGLLVGATAGLVFSIFATPALAAFPGANGNVAFARSGKLISQASSGREKTLVSATGASAPSYSPNGKKIVYQANTVIGGSPIPSSFTVWIANADGSGKKKLAQVDGVAPEPSFSANGKLVIYTNYDDNPMGDRRLFTVGIDGKGRKEFAPTVGGSMQEASWAPKGGKVAYVGGPSGTTAKLRTISTTGAKSSVKEIAPSLSDTFESPDWAPNGRTLVFVNWDTTANNKRVYRVNADRSGLKKLADFGADMGASEPVWAPNGKKVAFDKQNYRAGSFLGVWTMNPDGSGKKQFDKNGFDPAWQPR